MRQILWPMCAAFLLMAVPAAQAGEKAKITAEGLKGTWNGEIAITKGHQKGDVLTAQIILAKGDFSSVSGTALVKVTGSKGLGIKGRKIAFRLIGKGSNKRDIEFDYVGKVSDNGWQITGTFDSVYAEGSFKFTKQGEQ